MMKNKKWAWMVFGMTVLTGWESRGVGDRFVSRIHFNRDSHAVLETERPLLEQNVTWLKRHAEAVLILEGHCDEWGEDSYNLQLGDLRAREVKSYLIEQGINPDRMIMVVSYGEQRPLDPRSTREAWDANRRVEFVLR